MKQCINYLVIVTLYCVSTFSYAENVTTPDFVIEARQAINGFQKALKKELMFAIKSGGPEKAIEVCHSRAPEIAATISQQTGWEIGRTSLKTRNEKNVPNNVERAVLKQFEERKENGEAVTRLEWWRKNEGTITYMKAIPMQGMCTSCHGGNVNPSLKEHINQYYPHDMATGFEVGDIRGAFTLKKYLGHLGGKDSE